MTVLVVDDELAITEILCEALAEAGHKPIAARDGREGLEAYEREKPHVVVSDVMMPRLDGPSLVRAIRSRQDGAHTAIILMSAARPARRLADDPTLEHDLFLEKPFDLDHFIEQVGTFASGRIARR
jgi:two-component system cell cycle sensor histidine kinase/response regulator CckA